MGAASCRPAGLRQIPFLILLGLFAIVKSHASDGCDWVGSGLHQEESRGVQPVYLRCAQGHVEWRYPRGALRLVLHHGTSGREFKGCIRVSYRFSGARIYLEGHRQLHLLFSKNDGKHRDLLRCFASHNGQVALYIEAEPVKNSLQREVASFAYHLQPSSKMALLDDMSECRPCSEDEILQSYCTSDFIVRGSVVSLYHNAELERSELTVRAKDVIQDTEPAVFSAAMRPFYEREAGVQYATLHRPSKCGTKVGSGHFLFIGRRTLGSPVVYCAPRIGEWKKIRRKALLAGTNQCQLE